MGIVVFGVIGGAFAHDITSEFETRLNDRDYGKVVYSVHEDPSMPDSTAILSISYIPANHNNSGGISQNEQISILLSGIVLTIAIAFALYFIYSNDSLMSRKITLVIMIPLFVFLGAIFFIQSGTATPYWVDSSAGSGGDGTEENPWNNLQGAENNCSDTDTLHVNQGLYELSTFAIDVDITIDGENPWNTIIYVTNSVSLQDSGITIQDVSIYGGSCGIFSDGYDTLAITNCYIYSNDDGLYINDCDTLTITDCMVFKNTDDGLDLRSIIDLTITGCTIFNNGTAADEYGIYLYGITKYSLPENEISHCQIFRNEDCGIYMNGGGGSDCNDITISYCHIYENGEYGVYIDDPDCDDIEIDNTHIYSNGKIIAANGQGIYANGVDGFTLSNVYVYSNTDDGLYLYTSLNISITDSMFYDNDNGMLLDTMDASSANITITRVHVVNNRDDGIYIGNCDYLTMESCKILENGDAIGDHGIEMFCGSSTYDEYLIEKSVFYNNYSDGFNLEHRDDPDSFVIRKNNFYWNGDEGLEVVDGDSNIFIYNNNFIDNTGNNGEDNSTNGAYWDDNAVGSKTGNYWSNDTNGGTVNIPGTASASDRAGLSAPYNALFVEDGWGGTKNGGWDTPYDAIGTALTNASDGYVIGVKYGTYTEQNTITDTITILAEPEGGGANDYTKLDYGSSGHVLKLNDDAASNPGITVVGFELTHDDTSKRGLTIESDNNVVFNCEIYKNQYGIYILDAEYNIIIGNTSGKSSNGNNAGIRLEKITNDCKYNAVIDNTCIYNLANGIIIYGSCTYNTVTENTTSQNSKNGVRLGTCSEYNSITSNDIGKTATYNGNSESGIMLDWKSKYNVMTCNTIDDNADHGLLFYDDSSQNYIIYNEIFRNDDHGIYFKKYAGPGEGCHQNKIVHNTIGKSGYAQGDDGIQFDDDSHGNMILYNDIDYNTNVFAIELGSSTLNNMIHRNNFSNNNDTSTSEDQADDNSTDNYWDDGRKGNYWDDESGGDVYNVDQGTDNHPKTNSRISWNLGSA